MEVTWNKLNKGGFPTSVTHVRHSDWRPAMLFGPCLMSLIYLVVTGLALSAGEKIPTHAYALIVGPATIAILYETYYRLTHMQWLRTPVSIDEAQMVAGVKRAADTLGFGHELPPLPDTFPEMSNGELQAWCKGTAEVLEKQRKLIIRSQAGLPVLRATA